MTKIRQAVEYERQISDANWRHEREIRVAEKTAFEHERELRAVYDSHERELRIQAETAVEKARQLQFDAMELRLEGMNEFREQLRRQAGTFMTIERFEREHSNLVGRLEQAVATLTDKLGTEEKVTARQVAQEEMLAKVSQNNRWLIGILATVAIFGATTVLHIFKVI